MRRLPSMLVASLAVLAQPVLAEGLQPWEAGIGLGFIDPADKRNIDTDFAGLLTLERRLDRNWGAGVFGMFGHDIDVYGVRGLYHFDEPFYGWTPYVSAGLGLTDPSPGRTDTTALVGGGLKKPINDNLGLRAELNLHQGLDSGATDVSMFFGVTWSWGGSSSAPATQAAVAATATSSADVDHDHDGVPDAKDACPNTPAGAKVDSAGCPLDSDHDGIPDYKDQCPGTPAGANVDANGCPAADATDSDGDGVPDAKDQCPDTPAGAKVDANGCPAADAADSDGDGVPDSQDKCAGTPAGATVDAEGCPVKLTQKVGITLNLNFDTDKADVKPDFAGEIGKVAAFMRKYPGTSVVIEGHTDNTGSSEHNQKLSERRAQAVADSLVKDHGIAASRVQAVGYGDTRPIADNGTAEGRAQNRRVTASIEETVTR